MSPEEVRRVGSVLLCSRGRERMIRRWHTFTVEQIYLKAHLSSLPLALKECS